MQVTTCEETTRLDPRVRRTRKLIEDAFYSLLNERSYSEISVGEIADRATINRATFYAHYNDKEHLACSIVRSSMEAALLSSLAPDTPLNARTLGRFTGALFTFVAHTQGKCPKHADEMTATIMTTLVETIQQALRKWFDLDAKAILLFPGGSKDEVSTILAWAMYGSALRWSKLQPCPPAEDAAQQTVALLLR